MLISSGFDIALGGLLGLLVGSFLNVLIHRLPKIMERQWAQECASLTGTELAQQDAYNLMVPRSACPHCQHQIRWFENIPVVSYLVLRGRCSSCGAAISARYPLIELVTGALFAYCVWRWGIGPPAFAWCAFAAVLVALAAIDWDTTLLPDDLTLPLLWAGLASAAMGWTGIGLSTAFWGAVWGYGSLWLVYWAFKLATGKEGMGFGDFKLFGALGAWFGWQALIPIILMAAGLGTVVGLILKIKASLREGGYVPFGPFLALGGFTALLLGPQAMLSTLGL